MVQGSTHKTCLAQLLKKMWNHLNMYLFASHKKEGNSPEFIKTYEVSRGKGLARLRLTAVNKHV